MKRKDVKDENIRGQLEAQGAFNAEDKKEQEDGERVSMLEFMRSLASKKLEKNEVIELTEKGTFKHIYAAQLKVSSYGVFYIKADGRKGFKRLSVITGAEIRVM